MKHRPGFSLVELLVVVSIIGLLLGILLPVLARSRDTAMDIKCKSKLQQIGIAIAAYIAEHDGHLPDSGSDGSWGDLATRGLLPYFSYTGQSVAADRDFPWLCPTHDEFIWDGSHTSSYGYNVQFLLKEGPDYPHVGWNGFHNPGLLLSEIKEPSNVISILDHARPSGNTNLWTFVHRPGDATNLNGFGRPAFRHTDTANILFVDGHVHPGGPEIAQVSAEPKFWDPR